jgi:hypothetical protein
VACLAGQGHDECVGPREEMKCSALWFTCTAAIALITAQPATNEPTGCELVDAAGVAAWSAPVRLTLF